MDNQTPTSPTPPSTPTPSSNPTPPNTPPPAPGVGSSDGGSNDQHKALAIIGYIIPILFFIPLITDAKHNAFAKHHANQQLNLLLFWVVANVILMIPLLGWIIGLIMWIMGVVFLVMGVINAAQGTMKELPLIGKFTLIK